VITRYLEGGATVKVVTTGITRVVLLVGPVALKFPRPRWDGDREYGNRPGRTFLRGWLANQSEWRQRHRHDVVTPLATVAHLVLVMPRADYVGTLTMETACWVPWPVGAEAAAAEMQSRGDEIKPSSWGRFGQKWLLIDFDRAWEPALQGRLGRLYYRRQQRLAARWA
jgi:hypothetical protein